MSHSTIRIADDAQTLADFREVLAEYFEHLSEVWPTPDTPRWQREVDTLPGVYARPSGRMFVAYADGAPVGIVAIVGQGNGECEVKRLFVRPGARRAGVSRALMEFAMAEAGEAGYHVMRLGTSPTFTPAIALYASMGFEPVERFRDGFTDRAIFMSRRLDKSADAATTGADTPHA
jgi:GNAT superfamily N-acetyltransferase